MEVARSLLVGGGGRLAVREHGEAGGAPATFTASRRKSTEQREGGRGKQSISSMKAIPREPISPPGGAPQPRCPGKGLWPPRTFPTEPYDLGIQPRVNPSHAPRQRRAVPRVKCLPAPGTCEEGWPGPLGEPPSPGGAELVCCSALAKHKATKTKALLPEYS